MYQMKNKLFSAMLIICCLSLLMNGTVAYFTRSKIVDNVFTTSEIDITLNEKSNVIGQDGKHTQVDFADLEFNNVMPGQTISKIVTVTNKKESSDAYIRAKVEKHFTKPKVTNESDLSTDVIEIDFNNENWTFKDGWYYYNTVVNSGETTKPLFENVIFDGKGMGNEYKNSNCNISIVAQAVQVRNNETDVLSAKGWPALAIKK